MTRGTKDFVAYVGEKLGAVKLDRLSADNAARKVKRILAKFNARQDKLDERGDGSRIIHSRAHKASMAYVNRVHDAIRDSFIGII